MVPSTPQMIAAARHNYHRDGEIEIDECAIVSRAAGNANRGAYVQAWVWVDDADARALAKKPAKARRSLKRK